MDNILQEMRGVVNIADDIIIYGSNQQKHDSNFIHPYPERLEALHKIPAPKNISDLRIFLEITTYLALFTPNITRRLTPLRELTKKENIFTWTASYQTIFDTVKETICKPTTFAYYDTRRKYTT